MNISLHQGEAHSHLLGDHKSVALDLVENLLHRWKDWK
jgi:hypothetical protein